MPATVVSLNLNLSPYWPIRQSISASFNESFLKAVSKLSQVQLYLTPPPECGAAGTARLDTPRSDCIAVVPAECWNWIHIKYQSVRPLYASCASIMCSANHCILFHLVSGKVSLANMVLRQWALCRNHYNTFVTLTFLNAILQMYLSTVHTRITYVLADKETIPRKRNLSSWITECRPLHLCIHSFLLLDKRNALHGFAQIY
jgi:hypothetical protein